jgi:hypothetical protein
MNKKLLCFAALLFSAPALADNCSGGFSFQNGANAPGELSAGKITTWTSSSTVSSDNTPYNGTGQCSGYTFVKDGKTINSDVCVRTTADGDSWGTVGTVQPGAKRGEWRATFGTGKLAKNAGSSGWYEVSSSDEKGGMGKWGGNCLGVN